MPAYSRVKSPHRKTALKAAIFEDGREQQEIALAANINPIRLSHFIAGRRDLPFKEQKRLARTLRRTFAELGLDSEARAS